MITGMLLGALLCPCNIYAGLKIGWAFNMSITAALLGYAFWAPLCSMGKSRPWGILENNVNQTAASAAASIAGAGLVAPIPALSMITGQSLNLWQLCLWVLTVSMLGVLVAVILRPYLVSQLPFPSGIATAETLKQIHHQGDEASSRVRVLLFSGVLAAALKGWDAFIATLPSPALPGAVSLKAHGGSHVSLPLSKLGFVLDPSLLMVGFGTMIGLRAGVSLLFGAVLAWGIVLPWVIAKGWLASPDAHLGADSSFFAYGLDWLVWPGVTMMVVSSLLSFMLSLRGVVRSGRSVTLTPHELHPQDSARSAHATRQARHFFWGLMVLVCASAIALQMIFFDIAVLEATIAVILTLLLATVATRVSGETGITPIGAMGQMTQLSFAVVSPGNATSNLMAANVTGGAANQCADMMHDLKTGHLIAAKPHVQATGQVFGVLMGSVVGSMTYMIMIPDPSALLLSPEWPAPAVATWKAVAEVFMVGWDSLPPASGAAMLVASAVGAALSIAEFRLPQRYRRFVPSAASIGLACVIPAWNSLSMFAGAAIAALAHHYAKTWATRFILVIAAGLIAGESLIGILQVVLPEQ